MRTVLFLAAVLLTACGERDTDVALGTLERERIALTATVNEVIVELPVRQGERVTRGTVLVRLDDTLQKAQVSNAEANIHQAEANLEKLRNGARVEDVEAARAAVEKAKALLVEAESNYKRAVELWQSRTISEAKRDEALSSRDWHRAQLQSAKEELRKLTNGTRVEDLRAAEALLDSAVSVHASELKKMQDLTVTATRDGLLDSLPWNLGERVTEGSPVAIVLAGDAPFARVYVPEPYRAKLNVGDTLSVRVDGIDTPIAGRLRWISSDPAFTPYFALNQEERSRLMYLAEVQLPESEAGLPSGVPAQVELP